MKKFLIVPLVCAGLSLPSITSAAFPDAGVDDVPSLAKVKIKLTQEFAFYLKGLGAPFCQSASTAEECEADERTYESGFMSDPSTKVGRSDPHEDGDGTDEIDGAEVCKDGTLSTCNAYFDPTTDSEIHTVPTTNFVEGPAGVEEVHTRIISLNLEGPATPMPGNVSVKAGDETHCAPPSHGEVESIDSDEEGFPAESVFYVNVEVEFDMDGDAGLILFNKKALVLEAEIKGFPPHVVYVHSGVNNRAQPVYILDPKTCETHTAFPKPVGWLKVAGHGMDFDKGDRDDFQRVYDTFPDLLATLGDVTVEKMGNNVLVNWITLSERKTLGFNVWRAREIKEGEAATHILPDGTGVTDAGVINPQLIPTDSTMTYSHLDSDGLTSGNTYHYAIEDMDDDNKGTLHIDENDPIGSVDY